MLELRTKIDLQRLVDEGLEESLTLDYKASRALSREGKASEELCKDVSALANSAGGQLIYGIEEGKATKKPSVVDDGVSDPKITREWIEQILNSRVHPRMNGIQTGRIDMGNGKYGYVISVPQSQTGPHQAPDQKYYRRFGLQSAPMYDYEIKDVMRRSTTPNLSLSLNLGGAIPLTLRFNPGGAGGYSEPIPLIFAITNESSQPAKYVVITLSIDNRLNVSSTGDYEGPSANKGGVTTFKLVIAPPNWLPIFKESPDDIISKREFHIRIPSVSSIPNRFRVSTLIQSPGVVRAQSWDLVDNDRYLDLAEVPFD